MLWSIPRLQNLNLRSLVRLSSEAASLYRRSLNSQVACFASCSRLKRCSKSTIAGKLRPGVISFTTIVFFKPRLRLLLIDEGRVTGG